MAIGAVTLSKAALLDPSSISLTKEPWSELTLTLKEGERVTTYRDVRVRLAFPLSQGDRAVSFLLQDGTELGTLQDINSLDPASAEVLRSVLEITYFIPRIVKVREIREEFGVNRWTVETDRGPRTFDVQSRQDIRPAGPGRYIIRDIDGNRYEIRDVNALDAESRSWLDLEL